VTKQTGPEDRPLSRRLLWFVGLWLAGVGVVGLLAWVIRSVLL
jgi:hypothetical protein